jgi:hypothetical protein
VGLKIKSMTGKLIKKNNEWVVKYDKNHDEVFYVLCPQTKIWSEREDVKKFIHDDIEVQFNLVVNGSYDKINEMFVKEFCAKITQVEHSTI